MESHKTITVALVCPSDVAEERGFAEEAIEHVQKFVEEHGFRFAVRKWDDVPAGYYLVGLQNRIENELAIPACDFVIGIFGERYGVIEDSPYSRTAREILSAMEAKRQQGSPEVMVYFSRRSYRPSGPDESDDYSRVLRFKRELQDAGLRPKDIDPHDFKIEPAFDILRHLRQRLSSERRISCNVSCSPALVRAEGYTETVGVVRLALAGVIPPVKDGRFARAQIAITLTANVTNRVDGKHISDARVVSDRRGELGRGKLTKNNRLSFDPIPLGPPGSPIEEALTIEGIRTAAESFGVDAACGFRYGIKALLEMTLIDADPQDTVIVNDAFIIALVAPPMVGSVERVNSRDDTDESRSLIINYYSPFPNAFKSAHQEAQGPPASGIVFAIALAGIPEEFDVYATLCDFRPKAFGIASGPRFTAELALTSLSGFPIGRIGGPQRVPSWTEGTPLVRLENRGLLVAWELVKPLDLADPAILTFGISISSPRGESFPQAIKVVIGLGPFFTTALAAQASATLPIPRFVPGSRTFDVPLE